ncbi:hypothetical protein HPB49_016390 [Dermacentor silvarum]|uniref:Uncharacterized protein n=1 Tax=Dermacentor silvarum TaxID=543639 RepID=A0ACB8DEE2_DERSI|nr:hypothetical protein HPB49_016390 [Dermacentor silvarum]
MLLSRLVRQELRLNLHWNDQVTTQDDRRLSSFTVLGGNPRKPTAAEDVTRTYAELPCVSGYLRATSKFQVPFELRDTTVVKQRPTTSRETRNFGSKKMAESSCGRKWKSVVEHCWGRSSQMSLETRVAFLRYHECVDSLARGATNISLERPQDNQAPEYYFWLHGARTAYAALSASYAAERSSANWNTFWRAAQRTFFRRLCLLSCRPQHDTPDEHHSHDPAFVNLRSPAVPARASCMLPLLNMPEFVEAFECSQTAPACSPA